MLRGVGPIHESDHVCRIPGNRLYAVSATRDEIGEEYDQSGDLLRTFSIKRRQIYTSRHDSTVVPPLPWRIRATQVAKGADIEIRTVEAQQGRFRVQYDRRASRNLVGRHRPLHEYRR
ncbi:hypothetical protein PTKU64_91280 (plasmid) [Paraburkholderia terrae]|uniref:Uncharacterized protein n=1 Tax=Paraburkholderia terrae TaxID=311230 RepID=A0ABM7U277_9BURK|nr:hypothetical protein PTKU64_91280 [Paraburkholderia terrae]